MTTQGSARATGTWLLGGVLAVAGVWLLLGTGGPATAADCPYGPYGCPKAVTTLTTVAGPSGAEVGDVLTAQSTLGNGDGPTGSMTFRLFDPADQTCTNPVYESVVAVSGNGAYVDGSGTKTGSAVTTKPGTWRWTVAYSGDDKNEASTSGCPESPVTVVKATTQLTVVATPDVAERGTELSVSATVVGGYLPAGQVSFTLYEPPKHNQPCGIVRTTGTASLVDGQASFSVTLPRRGQRLGEWEWVAAYAGDGNNTGSASTCGEATTRVVSHLPQ